MIETDRQTETYIVSGWAGRWRRVHVIDVNCRGQKVTVARWRVDGQCEVAVTRWLWIRSSIDILLPWLGRTYSSTPSSTSLWLLHSTL